GIAAARLIAWLKGFIGALCGHTGRNEVAVYEPKDWFQSKLAPENLLDPGVFLWVAHYGREPGKPGYLTDRVAIHQYTSEGQVPGINAKTDLNVSLVDLAALTGGQGAPPPQIGRASCRERARAP